MNWGRLLHIAGIGCLVVAFGWWFVSLFWLFAEFYKYSGIDLLILPLFKLFTNPLLWISIVLLKLAQRISPHPEQPSSSDNQDYS